MQPMAQRSTTERLLPNPFERDDIRRALQPGAMRRFTTVGTAGTRSDLVWNVLAADDEGCTLRYGYVTENGEPLGEPMERVVSWQELVEIGRFNEITGVVRDREVTVPAGTFACRVYTVTERRGQDILVSTYSFAVAVPGPPVRYAGVRNGVPESLTELQAYAPPPQT
jgi:hypothetical protein